MIKGLAILCLGLGSALADEAPAIKLVRTAALAFLESLDEERSALARIPFHSPERENWHYVPTSRKGLALAEMNDSQKNAAVTLANAVFSETGALKAAQIIALESILAELENAPDFRDPEQYSVSVFGSPGAETGWGFRFEGHHLSSNITIVGDDVSLTPSFMGANPAEVQNGEMKGQRVLANEEDLARSLVVSLVKAGKTKVIFSQRPPREIITGQDREASALETVGIAAIELSNPEKAQLIEIVALYTGRYREEFAESDLERMTGAGLNKVHFAWAGGYAKGEPFYYRIQGPTFLIEACNVQNGANHLHTVWRDFENDFGRDLLRDHLENH